VPRGVPPQTPASPGSARGGRRRQMGLRSGLVAGLGAAAGRNNSWAELGCLLAGPYEAGVAERERVKNSEGSIRPPRLLRTAS
jgi:ferric-dicitrate binding protein FerR (iron transport regulator)